MEFFPGFTSARTIGEEETILDKISGVMWTVSSCSSARPASTICSYNYRIPPSPPPQKKNSGRFRLDKKVPSVVFLSKRSAVVVESDRLPRHANFILQKNCTSSAFRARDFVWVCMGGTGVKTLSGLGAAGYGHF